MPYARRQDFPRDPLTNRRLTQNTIATVCFACRSWLSHSPSPPAARDMHDQPRYKPLAFTDFFGDGRSARPTVEGTVARGHLRIDRVRYTGKNGTDDVDFFPFPITRDELLRGQERFNIFCSPCHSRTGDGNGMVVRRGFRQAANYHSDKLLKAPVGHFFRRHHHGFGAMRAMVRASKRTTAGELPPTSACFSSVGTRPSTTSLPRDAPNWRPPGSDAFRSSYDADRPVAAAVADGRHRRVGVGDCRILVRP